jgi:hypothetical protein
VPRPPALHEPPRNARAFLESQRAVVATTSLARNPRHAATMHTQTRSDQTAVPPRADDEHAALSSE